MRPALVAFAVGALLTPIGLLAHGNGFGEDAPDDLDLHRYHLQAVPDGLARYAGFWHHALFAGYDFRHDSHPVLGYVVSTDFIFFGLTGLSLFIFRPAVGMP